MRLHPLLPAALATVLVALPSSPVRADSLLARPAGASPLVEARAALARGPSRSTAWYQLRVEPGADELFWVLPVPAGVGVDIAPASFFDALEQSTAPRVLPPPGASPKGQICTRPTVQIVSDGDATTVGGLAAQEVFTDLAALVARASSLGYDAGRLDPAALQPTLTAGGRLLALRLSPAPLATATEATVTVRLHGPGVGLEALPTLPGGPSGVAFTLWLLGDGRGRAGGAGEVEMNPSSLRWTGLTTTNYLTERDALLAPGAGATVVLEVASPRPLREVISLPGGAIVPPLVDSYLRRVFERGEASGNLGTFSGQAGKSLGSTFAESCPRGDLLDAAPPCLPGVGDDPAVLTPSASTDDLAFVYAGQASQRWVTRLAGLMPAQTSPPALTADFSASDPVSLLYTPASIWTDLCQSPATQGTGGAGGQGSGQGGGGKSSGNGNQSSSYGASDGTGFGDDEDAVSTAESASSGVSCAAAFGNAMCSTADPGSGNDSCDCGGSGGGDGEDSDSCSSGSGGSSSEGCGCGDGSTEEGSGEACSGAGGDTGNSCSGSDTNSGGDSCGKCSAGRARRSPPRLSKWLIVVTALALPLRRRTRPRHRDSYRVVETLDRLGYPDRQRQRAHAHRGPAPEVQR